SPYKEILEFYRLFVLSNAALNHQRAQFSIPPEQQLAYYNSHSEDYREARVRMIYVPFEDEKSEALAKSKAADFAKQARSGVDFVKLAKSNEKESTVATGEEFVVKPDSNQPPEQMRKVLLASKAGTITDPLRHDNGYYVFRIESVAVQPYASVKDEIFRKLGDDHAREWQNKIQGQITVQIENEAFFQSNAKQ
ncbi:MAG: peptidyl-prolyl cis-trans isomerase, partial [Bryobacteraceae bacterium]|nr:peptidyl-prolyl cis-trans isomerase [Bryobacteraceae bacterium]